MDVTTTVLTALSRMHADMFSMPMDTAVSEAIRLSEAGVQEIVVTGIEISSYGRDLPGQPSLLDLIVQLCQAVPHTYIRLGSLEPRTIDENFC